MPGAGQLYNKERAKGFLLIGLTTAVMLAFFVGVTLALARIIPPGATSLTPTEASALMHRLMAEHKSYFLAFQYLALAIWGYGVVDAYLGARDRARGLPSAGVPR